MTCVRAIEIEIADDETRYLNIIEMDDGEGHLCGSSIIIDRYQYSTHQDKDARRLWESNYGEIQHVRVPQDYKGSKKIGNNFAVVRDALNVWSEANRIAEGDYERKKQKDLTNISVRLEMREVGTRQIQLDFPNDSTFRRFMNAMSSATDHTILKSAYTTLRDLIDKAENTKDDKVSACTLADVSSDPNRCKCGLDSLVDGKCACGAQN